MERRWTTRTEINVGLEITSSGKVISNCEAKDIGLGGAYILTKGSNLNEGSDVELNFKLDSQDEGSEHVIRAKVVRLYKDGAGLMFKDFDAVAFRVLQKVIKTYGAAPTQPIMG